MLHRLTLRVLPHLNSIVTEPTVRKRKRLVMLAPGLIAFVLYQITKQVLPLSDPFVLLAFSGSLCSLTALWAYRMGRGVSLATSIHEDGKRLWVWLLGWVGFAYGVQLSLLVLALLKLFVAYDFLLHPEGPAMMAIIISCTSVTRDAFEIGVVRLMEQHGQPALTFPDGRGFRRWARIEPTAIGRWAGLAALVAMGSSLAFTVSLQMGQSQLAQTLFMSVLIACFALVAFFSSESRSGNWLERAKQVGWFQTIRFWIWPCFTFTATYYLVQVGILTFLMGMDGSQLFIQGGVAGITAAMMTSYCYYLGRRKLLEVQSEAGTLENLESCPFVMGILSKAGIVPEETNKGSSPALAVHSDEVRGRS